MSLSEPPDITPDVDPVRYTGERQPDPAFYDGRLPHAVGVHHIQAFRASRERTADWPGHTYNHQPYLAWWRERFYLHFLSAPVHEHEAPTITFLISSPDGYAWSAPRVLFPEYVLPAFELDGVRFPAGISAVMHQRMGFYVAPNDRLLAVGFYGICPDHHHSPNAGHGVGRVVREIHRDDTLGEICFLRYNRHAGFDERNTRYPFYTASADAGFRAACDALLADKLETLQWWEEDRGRDGFFALDPAAVAGAATFHARMVTSAGAGKAFTWFTRRDGVVVGLWKNQYTALSRDRGRTWTPITRNRTLRTTGAKTWGQRTADGRYAIVYNHSATMANRFPISALVGDDGQDFPTLLCLGGEVPPRRYRGQHKGRGMHYFRGISEGGPQPPGQDLWIAYSVNKEDLWILRARLPLTAQGPAVQPSEIATARSLGDLSAWNLYLPQWAAARLVREAETGVQVLELRDEDPWDRAQAERVFPTARRVRIRLRCQVRELPPGATFQIEVQSQQHHRPVRLCCSEGLLSLDGVTPFAASVPFGLRRWHELAVECDAVVGCYTLFVDGVPVRTDVRFAESSPALERIVLRTGPWRGEVPAHLVRAGEKKPTGLDTDDLEAPGNRVQATVIWIGELDVESC